MPSPLGAFYRSPLGAFYRSPLGARGGSELYDTWKVELTGLPTFEVYKVGTGAFSAPVLMQTFDGAIAFYTRYGAGRFLQRALQPSSVHFTWHAWAIDTAGFTEISLDDTPNSHPGWAFRDDESDVTDAVGGTFLSPYGGTEAAIVAANPIDFDFPSAANTLSLVPGSQTLRGFAVSMIDNVGTPAGFEFLIDLGADVTINYSDDVNRPNTTIKVASGSAMRLRVSANV